MPKQSLDQKIALQGSMRAVTKIEAEGEPKIGVDEFMALCKRFGFSRKTLQAIRATVREEDWGEGPFLANYYSGLKESAVQAFERTARDVFGVKHAMGVSSGTGALHAAFVAAGVAPDTEVICPAIGFSATANAAALIGAKPVFCDVDESLHMDPTKLEALITDCTAAIAPTHVMGGVCKMDAIMRVARKHKLKVVEDCAQSCGAQYTGRYVGTFGDLGIFSISCYKIVGAGEGGLLLAKTKRLWERASQVVESGGLWRPVRFAPPRYEGELFAGTNYRMSELEAAIDAVQLKKMPKTVRRFQTVKQRIVKRLRPFAGISPQLLNDSNGEVGYTLRFIPDTIALGEQVVAALRDRHVDAGMRGANGADDWHCYHYMHPLSTKHGIKRGDCPVADRLFDSVITVSLNQWYTAADCRAVAERINEALASCCAPDDNGKAWDRTVS
ncbi:MAG: DegT/DnrJ/EryC1/StrS family aminotransferase [bacterium]|nr:DegT/DnrJ/EryC1/StrS family aminotransferase [bacterium]